MKRFASALGMLIVVALPAQGHFIWIVPDDAAVARVVFSDSLEPDSPELLAKIAHTELFVRDANGKDAPLKWTDGKNAAVLNVPGSGARLVGGVCRYGIIQRGQTEPFLLMYYPKCFLGGAVAGKRCERLPLEIVRTEGGSLQVLWEGKPLPDAEVVIVHGKDKDVTIQTDKEGTVPLKASDPGLYGLRVRHVEKKEGEIEGKKYKEVRHYATLVYQVKEGQASGKDDPPAKRSADPAASKLLADARAARAQWQNFPGFRADLEVNLDGKVVTGKLEVNAKGKLQLAVPDAAAEAWAKRQLASLVGHRVDNSASLNTPCDFPDDDAAHPLGRNIRVLNDEFHSSYRIRDRQIIVVNRRMHDSRFTITVLENRLNDEKQFLPVSFVVNTWDLKTEALRSSEAYHHTWLRIGKFDLPLSLTVVAATAGKLEGRSLKLMNHKLEK